MSLGALLGFSSSILSTGLDVPLSLFFISPNRGVLELTVTEKLITKARVGEACVQVPAPSALPPTTGVTVGKGLLLCAAVSSSIKCGGLT